MSKPKIIPVIDLFAGPGGLGEGFSSYSGDTRFEVRLSIERDSTAYKTLQLRAAYRLLRQQGNLQAYYDFVSGRISRHEFEGYASVREALAEASNEARQIELGAASVDESTHAIEQTGISNEDWVLIGGPPCQAYSLIGRSRNANVQDFHLDDRHFLYKEYLRVLRDFSPPIFVMENVKGLLSSQRDRGEGMFQAILRDLRNTGNAEYEIRSVVVDKAADELSATDFIVRAEQYGVPQARHRVILLGVRKDVAQRATHNHTLTRSLDETPVSSVIQGLPVLRSRLSRDDSRDAWLAALDIAIEGVVGADSLPAWKRQLAPHMRERRQQAASIESVGAEFVATDVPPTKGFSKLDNNLRRFLRVNELPGALHHHARSHMALDVARYFFSSSFAELFGRSATLEAFPKALLPAHANVGRKDAPFKDRFRVQLREQPANTIVAHLSKDGHAFIHYDASQARSLTVREAARAQTFPDDYFFEGGRTAQYVQVGNAVPPYLARQIAAIVSKYLSS